MNKSVGLVLLVVFAFSLAFPVKALPVFQDDFEREEIGSDWSVVRNAWSIEAGELKGEGVDALLASGQYYSDAVIEVKVRIVDHGISDKYWVGLMTRAANPDDDIWTSGYLVYLRDNGSIELYTREDGVIARAHTGVTPDDFVTIKASFVGSSIKVCVNGVLYLDVTHDRYAAGYVSLKNYVAEGRFDDVVIEDPYGLPPNVVPEPAPILISLLMVGAIAAYGMLKYRKRPLIPPT